MSKLRKKELQVARATLSLRRALEIFQITIIIFSLIKIKRSDEKWWKYRIVTPCDEILILR